MLLVVPHELRNELEEADAKGIATLTLYGLEGWQRALELARPDRVLTVGAPPELSAELQIQGYDVQQDQPESPRKAPQ